MFFIQLLTNFTLLMIQKSNNISLIYTPRTNYQRIINHHDALLAELTLNFDKHTIQTMKTHFLKADSSLTLESFVVLCRQFMSKWRSQEKQQYQTLNRCLLMLFQQIDLDGNGTLDWDQFTNYIIEKAVSLKNQNIGIQETKQLRPCKFIPKAKFASPVTKAILTLKSYIMFQYGTQNIYILDREKLTLSTKSLTYDSQIKPYLIQIIFLDKRQIIITASSDNYVRGLVVKDNRLAPAKMLTNDKEIMQAKFKRQINCMAADSNQILYIGYKDGSISTWHLTSDIKKNIAMGLTSQKDKKQKQLEIAHDGLITCINILQGLQLLVSAGLDGKVILWNLLNNKKKSMFHQHSSGVITTCFQQSLALLFTGGIDHRICVINPYINSLIHKIEAHKSTITSLAIIDSLGQILSLDIDGICKVHDLITMNLIKTYNLQNKDQKQSLNFTCLQVVNKEIGKPLVVFFGKAIRMYQYDNFWQSNKVQDQIGCRYSFRHLSFYEAVGKKINIWSALTGQLIKIYTLTKANITCFQLDQLHKRILTGDNSGKAMVFNILNGVLISTLPSHQRQVFSISQSMLGQRSVLVSVGLQRVAHICSDLSFKKGEILRKIQFGDSFNIQCFAYLPEQRATVVGTNDGSLLFFQCQSKKQVGQSRQSSDCQVTSIKSVENFPFIIVTYNNGKISVVMTAPFIYKSHKVYTVLNLNPQHKKASSVQRSQLLRQRFWLIVIDGGGSIKCFDFSDIFQRLQPFQLDRFQQSMIYKKPDIRSAKIRVIWQTQIKDVVTSLYLAQRPYMLITCSSDRIIRIWDIETGELSQKISKRNFSIKAGDRPLAVLRVDTLELMASDFTTVIQQIDEIDLYRLQFDPFYNFNLLKDPRINSGSSWKLYIDFEQHFLEREKDLMKVFSIRGRQTSRLTKKIELKKLINRLKSYEIMKQFVREDIIRLQTLQSVNTEREQPPPVFLQNKSSQMKVKLPNLSRQIMRKYNIQPINLQEEKKRKIEVGHRSLKRLTQSLRYQEKTFTVSQDISGRLMKLNCLLKNQEK